ncbi:pyridoxal phosphate (PLP) phosphatase [Mycobacteroides abscessus subsp. abscessus]|uniref:HAD hydrolase family protein n=1 Tax=Dermabacter TaxID=36739 RepID=UPI00092A05C3|nr:MULTISPECIES: HAD hydrolase family protein [Dermabacter]MCG7444182.1 HAD family hydrolase [Dermabacter vaginalis]RUP87046.1 HAD family phosphatase [Dermabacter sp. HSID17554]SHV78639.1 pyridoxal phosphate (PLP) phosphatase [Mycobacteroides abscessus subsp. abscessus]
MSEQHALFLDFDGTLADHGIVPAAHVEALQRVREAGHLAFLCTGRPHSLIPHDVEDALDGVIGSAGAYVKFGDLILEDSRFPDDLAKRTLRVLQEAGDFPFVLESPEATVGNHTAERYIRERLTRSFSTQEVLPAKEVGTLGGGASELLDAFVLRESLAGVSFAKVVAWQIPVAITEIARKIGPKVRDMPYSLGDDQETSGELQLAAIDKIDGVKRMLAHVEIPIERAVGFGDGMNDIGMLKGVGLPVPVEGSDASRAIADPAFVMRGPREGGFAEAIEQLGLV